MDRIKYYQAEKARLCTCASYLRDIFASPSSNVDELGDVKNILKEMIARVDTWQRLIDGQYDFERLVGDTKDE